MAFSHAIRLSIASRSTVETMTSTSSYNKERNLSFYKRNGFNYLFSTEEQEREFRGIKPERPLNSRLMYFDLIELIRK